LSLHSIPTMAAISSWARNASSTSSKYQGQCSLWYVHLTHGDSLTVLDTSLVIIGDRVQMGPNVSIYTAGHETSVLSRRKFVEFGHPVRIGNDCWIGGCVIILPGVTIGEGCTIGAGSVVTKDIPPFSVAVGAPCRVKKTIPSAEEDEQDPNNPYRHMNRDF
jgi:acetyltransferase-like isoleucine patch superfamily enzyme